MLFKFRKTELAGILLCYLTREFITQFTCRNVGMNVKSTKGTNTSYYLTDSSSNN